MSAAFPVLALLLIAAAPEPGLDDDAIYAARFHAMMTGADYYQPLEPIPGAAHPTPLPVADNPSIAPQALDAATRYAQANRSRAFLVWHNGALERADYFNPTEASTPLNSRSLAKPLSAIVVGRAIALGFVKSLDQPVRDFIPEWRDTPKAAMTVRMLLDMRSGLQGQYATQDPDDILNRVYLSPRHDEILVREYKLTHEPGTRFDYANAVADLVAIVIEAATAQRYAAFLSTQVLQPLGAQGGSVWVDRPGGLAHSACCIMLPAETWLRIGILLLQDGAWNGARLLPDGYVAAMRQGTKQNPAYGLGVFVPAPYTERRAFGNPDVAGPRVLQSEPFLARDVTMFDGLADQVVYIIPSQQLVILRMGDPPKREPEWDNAILANTVLRGITPPIPPADAQPRQ